MPVIIWDTIPSTSVSETTINTSLDNLYIALNGIHKEMVSQESGYQCLGGEPGFMMSRDAEADDMNWQTNSMDEGGLFRMAMQYE